jgi:hypothetical protein
MKFLDRDGRATLWFALGQLWNWHASADDVNVFDNLGVRPNSAYVRAAVAYFSGRLRAYRGHYAEMALVHFGMHPRGRQWLVMSAQERADWHRSTFPALVQRECGYNLVMVDDGFVRLRTLLYLNPRCKRWHARVVAARPNAQQQHILALLHSAALHLLARVHNNHDALDRVLRRAHTRLLEPVHYV